MAFSCVPFRQCTAMSKIIHTKWYLHTKSSHRLLRRRTHSLWDYRTMKSRTPPPNCSFLPSLLSFFANFYPNVQTEEIYQTFHTRHGAQMFPSNPHKCQKLSTYRNTCDAPSPDKTYPEFRKTGGSAPKWRKNQKNWIYQHRLWLG